MHSPDLTQSNIDKVAELFPTVVTETMTCTETSEAHTHSRDCYARAIDFDLLRQELSDHVVEGPQERYQLDWPGKREALFAANAPIAKTLRPVREESVDFDTTKNIFIEGDNLDALKLLQESYLGKIKLIYIDPPYNTGKDAFMYPDDFVEGNAQYLQRSRQVDGDGGRLRANLESSGRFHSDWLTMMYPRLRLARNLLSDTGAIFVSIDDGESAGLRAMLDDVFGASNFVTTIAWQKVYSPMNSATQFASVHDYIHVYARDASTWVSNLLPRTAEQDAAYKNPDQDPRGPWKPTDATAAAGHATPTQFYELATPAGNRFTPPAGRAWLYTEPRFAEMVADNRVWFGGDGQGRPAIKRFLTEVKQGRIAQTFWPYTEVGHNQEAKKELVALMSLQASDLVFDTPKPTRLIRRMLQLATTATGGDIVMDFFAGSGTTADAVHRQNAADGGNRRCISVQIGEPTQSVRFPTISDFCMERIRLSAGAAAADAGLESAGLDWGLRILRVDSTNIADLLRTPDEQEQGTLALSTDSIRPGRTSEDLLFQVLLDWGLPLDLPIERMPLDGAEVFDVDAGTLVTCFDDTLSAGVIRAIAEHAPVGVVVRDSAFADDSARINAEQIIREVSPDTIFRAI